MKYKQKDNISYFIYNLYYYAIDDNDKETYILGVNDLLFRIYNIKIYKKKSKPNLYDKILLNFLSIVMFLTMIILSISLFFIIFTWLFYNLSIILKWLSLHHKIINNKKEYNNMKNSLKGLFSYIDYLNDYQIIDDNKILDNLSREVGFINFNEMRMNEHKVDIYVKILFNKLCVKNNISPPFEIEV